MKMTFKLIALTFVSLIFCGCVSQAKKDVVVSSVQTKDARFYLTTEENSDVLSHKPIKVVAPVTTQTVAHDVL